MNDKLEQYKLKYDYVLKVRELNQQQAFFKIPKYLILKGIIPFFEDEDIMPFALTCKIFKTIIYSPLGFEILLASRPKVQPNAHPPVHFNQTQAAMLTNISEELKRFEGNSEDAMAQLLTLMNVKEFLTAKVKTLEEVIKSHQREIVKLKGNLMYEQNLNKKNVEKIMAMDNRVKAFELEKEDHDGTLRELNMTYQKLLSEKEGDIKLYKGECESLTKTKDDLVDEISFLRNENEKLNSKNIQYVNALTRLKAAFSVNPYAKTLENLESQPVEAKSSYIL